MYRPGRKVMGMSTHTDDGVKRTRTAFLTRKVVIWASWDAGSSAFNAVITTFVFSVYLTTPQLFGESANANLGWTTALAGVLVALAAPALGQWADRTGKTHTVLTVTTLALVGLMGAMFFVRPSEHYVWLGLTLLAVSNFVFEVGSVIYNSMVSDISTPENVGRVSGFGWGLGYIGSILLLVILLFGFIQPDVGLFGVTSEDAMNIRVSMVVCALWTLIFCLPLLVTSRNQPPSGEPSRGFFGSYAELGHSIKHLWRKDRSVVWFLVSSAIYRDGLAGVFTFGGVWAGVAFGFEKNEVLLFGIAANLVAGVATVIFGQLDDKVGPRKVIIGSLTAMCTLALIVFLGKPAGPVVFWVFGLALCVFVGPTQAASRSYLARVSPPGASAEMFGLYATTGRAVSFLSSVLYSSSITLASITSGQPKKDVAIYGILGIIILLLVGLATFIPVRPESSTSHRSDDRIKARTSG